MTCALDSENFRAMPTFQPHPPPLLLSCNINMKVNFKTHFQILQVHRVTQFHVTNWSSDGTCSNLKVLTDVIEEVAKVQRRTGNYPILVHCR